MKMVTIFILILIVDSYEFKTEEVRIGQLSIANFFKKLGSESNLSRISHKITKLCPYSVITDYWKKAFIQFQVDIFFVKNHKKKKDIKLFIRKQNKFLSLILKIALHCSQNLFKKQRKLIKSAIRKLNKKRNYNVRYYFITLAELISGKSQSLFKTGSNELHKFKKIYSLKRKIYNFLRKSPKK